MRRYSFLTANSKIIAQAETVSSLEMILMLLAIKLHGAIQPMTYELITDLGDNPAQLGDSCYECGTRLPTPSGKHGKLMFLRGVTYAVFRMCPDCLPAGEGRA